MFLNVFVLMTGTILGAYSPSAFLWAFGMCCLAAFLLGKTRKVSQLFLPSLAIFLGLYFWGLIGTFLVHQYYLFGIRVIFLIPVLLAIFFPTKFFIAFVILEALFDLTFDIVNISKYALWSPLHQSLAVAIAFRSTGIILAIRYIIVDWQQSPKGSESRSAFVTKYWFKPKLGKWGVGMPITWEGWVASILFSTAVIIWAWILGYFNENFKPVSFPQSLMFISGGIFISLAFCYFVKDKVEGGVGF